MSSALRLAYNTPRGIIHPSQVDFGVHFEYETSHYEETFVGVGTHYIQARPRGMDFLPPGNIDNYLVSQQWVEINSTSSCRIMACFRFLVDHPSETACLFGLVETNTDPFFTPPTNGVYFFHQPGFSAGSLNAVSVAEGESTETLGLVTTNENEFYDVSLVWHRGSAAEFLVLEHGRRWSSYIHTTNVPAAALRQTFAVLRGGSLGSLVVSAASIDLQAFKS